MATQRGLGTRLRQLTAALDGDVQALYDEMDANFRSRFFPLMQHLLANGSSSVGALAEAAGVSQPAATQTIDEMMRLGLVEAADSASRRERRTQLAAEGHALAERLAPLWAAVAAAAEELDRALPHRLTATVDEALALLAHQSFADRIREHLTSQDKP